MTKKQKVWLGVSLAMFVVPEVLWGAIIKILDVSFVPVYKDPQFFYDHPFFALLLIVVELIGISGLIYVVNKISLRNFSKYFLRNFLCSFSYWFSS